MLVGYAVIPAARDVIDKDVLRWQECKVRPERGLHATLLLLTDTTHEFRNLYNVRLAKAGLLGLIIRRGQAIVFKPELSLFVRTRPASTPAPTARAAATPTQPAVSAEAGTTTNRCNSPSSVASSRAVNGAKDVARTLSTISPPASRSRFPLPVRR